MGELSPTARAQADLGGRGRGGKPSEGSGQGGPCDSFSAPAGAHFTLVPQTMDFGLEEFSPLISCVLCLTTADRIQLGIEALLWTQERAQPVGSDSPLPTRGRQGGQWTLAVAYDS